MECPGGHQGRQKPKVSVIGFSRHQAGKAEFFAVATGPCRDGLGMAGEHEERRLGGPKRGWAKIGHQAAAKGAQYAALPPGKRRPRCLACAGARHFGAT